MGHTDGNAPLSMAEIERAYDDWLAANRAANTRKRRLGTLRQYAAHVAPLSPLTASGELAEEWLRRFSSMATRSAYDEDLRAFYSWALKRRLLAQDPLLDLERPRRPHGMPRPLSQAEWQRAITETCDMRVRAALMLAGMAGLRRAEICALRGEDITTDGDSPVLVVRGEREAGTEPCRYTHALRSSCGACPATGRFCRAARDPELCRPIISAR